MKLFNIKALLLLAISSVMFFQACDEDSTEPTTDNPIITSIMPATGNIGDEITIKGSGFGLEDEAGSVFFIKGTDQIQAPDENYKAWSDTEITVVIPADAPTGEITVKVYNGETDRYSDAADFTVGSAPEAPTALMATSKDANTVTIKWTASNTEGVEYKVYYKAEGDADFTDFDPGTDNPVDVMNLLESTVYTFKVTAVKDNIESAAAEIMWAPAMRFVDPTKFKMYEFDSQNGSAIDLFDETEGTPMNLTFADVAKANVSLNTKDGNMILEIGSNITLGSGGAQETELGKIVTEVVSLDEVFDSEGMDQGNYSVTNVDLTNESVVGSKNLVLYLRTVEPGQTEPNYAKLILKRVGGKFMQGSGDDEYIECEISYQKKAGVPYARKAM